MVDVRLTPRESVPRWLSYGTPVITVLAALAVSAVALLALDVNPLAAYYEMFVVTMSDRSGVIETLIKAVPLALAGLAVYVPYRADLWNIGAEGQLYVGAIAGTWAAVNLDVGGMALLATVLVAGGIAGGLYGAVAGALRAKWGVNEIIVTLMMTFVATRITSYLVQGPMQGNAGALSGSAQLPAAATIPTLGDTRLHAGILLALLATVLVWAFVSRTVYGFQIKITGSNPDTAEQAGMNRELLYLLVFVIGGALAGLAGIIEIAGVQGRLRASFSPGYGFTAIPIALLGRKGAFRVLLAALFFAVLFVGGQTIVVTHDVPSSIVEIIQALVILFLITAEFFKEFRLEIDTGGPTPVGAAADPVGEQ